MLVRASARLANVGSAVRRQATVRSRLSPRFCHSHHLVISQANMQVKLIPALEDNYMYLLIDEDTKQCAAVDPVEPEKIVAALNEEGMKLSCVLTTHHHWDHAGGNEKLTQLLGETAVYGGDERIGNLTKKVTHGEELKVGSLNIQCLFTPCHTTGHICYYVTSPDTQQQPAVFTGDTLFLGGCGRFFEGNAEDMHTALVKILSALPKKTRVYCGHEYSVNNLKFALHVEPFNQAVIDKLAWAEDQRASKKATIPSTIGEELEINPFMRVREDAVQKHTGRQDPVEVMGVLREEKNTFRPPPV